MVARVRVTHIVTKRQRPRLRTPVGTYEFHVLQDELFGGFRPYNRTADFLIATPEKALFDTLYLSTRRGARYRSLPEVELPADFSNAELEKWISTGISHQPVATAVRKRWNELEERLTGQL